MGRSSKIRHRRQRRLTSKIWKMGQKILKYMRALTPDQKLLMSVPTAAENLDLYLEEPQKPEPRAN